LFRFRFRFYRVLVKHIVRLSFHSSRVHRFRLFCLSSFLKYRIHASFVSFNELRPRRSHLAATRPFLFCFYLRFHFRFHFQSRFNSHTVYRQLLLRPASFLSSRVVSFVSRFFVFVLRRFVILRARRLKSLKKFLYYLLFRFRDTVTENSYRFFSYFFISLFLLYLYSETVSRHLSTIDQDHRSTITCEKKTSRQGPVRRRPARKRLTRRLPVRRRIARRRFKRRLTRRIARRRSARRNEETCEENIGKNIAPPSITSRRKSKTTLSSPSETVSTTTRP
jgi:hypothetical protein